MLNTIGDGYCTTPTCQWERGRTRVKPRPSASRVSPFALHLANGALGGWVVRSAASHTPQAVSGLSLTLLLCLKVR